MFIKNPYTRKWREINKDYYKEYMREYMTNYRNKIKLKMTNTKSKKLQGKNKKKINFTIERKTIIIYF